jgi:hypothetical protein
MSDQFNRSLILSALSLFIIFFGYQVLIPMVSARAEQAACLREHQGKSFIQQKEIARIKSKCFIKALQNYDNDCKKNGEPYYITDCESSLVQLGNSFR